MSLYRRRDQGVASVENQVETGLDLARGSAEDEVDRAKHGERADVPRRTRGSGPSARRIRIHGAGHREHAAVRRRCCGSDGVEVPAARRHPIPEFDRARRIEHGRRRQVILLAVGSGRPGLHRDPAAEPVTHASVRGERIRIVRTAARRGDLGRQHGGQQEGDRERESQTGNAHPAILSLRYGPTPSSLRRLPDDLGLPVDHPVRPSALFILTLLGIQRTDLDERTWGRFLELGEEEWRQVREGVEGTKALPFLAEHAHNRWA